MSTSARSSNAGPRLSARAVDVHLNADILEVRLEDGRTIGVPIVWFPRLEAATERQRQNWELMGRGIGIHWPDVDEDTSVENLLATDDDLLAYRDGVVSHDPRGDLAPSSGQSEQSAPDVGERDPRTRSRRDPGF